MVVQDIRNIFVDKFKRNDITRNDTGSISGSDTLEIVGASFIADEESIFGEVNRGYVAREIEWYQSQSLNVNDIRGDVPKIWKAVATPDGFINSNYGHLIYSDENHLQYDKVLTKLVESPSTRQAVMVYTRPTIHDEWNRDGMKDFICTNAVQYLIRDSRMHAVVQMRSNDAWAGYRNDRAWAKTVLEDLVSDFNYCKNTSIEVGTIYWQVGSLHVYSAQFKLIEKYINECGL